MLKVLDFPRESITFKIHKGDAVTHDDCTIQRLGEIEEEEPNVTRCYVILNRPPILPPGKNFKWATFSYGGHTWRVIEERTYSLFNTRVRLKATRFDDLPSLYTR